MNAAHPVRIRSSHILSHILLSWHEVLLLVRWDPAHERLLSNSLQFEIFVELRVIVWPDRDMLHAYN